MKLNTLMTISAILGFVFGLAFILLPAQLLALYGIMADAVGQIIGRYLGSAFLGLAVLNWVARNEPEGGALGAIVLGTFIFSAAGLGVSLLQGLSGPGNALVWLNVVIYLFMTLGYGYFEFIKSTGSLRAHHV